MDSIETDRLKKLKAKRAALDARVRQEQHKLNKAERDRDTRRKVLAGAAVLQWAKRDDEFAARLLKEIDGFYTRDDERALFGLAPLPASKKP